MLLNQRPYNKKSQQTLLIYECKCKSMAFHVKRHPQVSAAAASAAFFGESSNSSMTELVLYFSLGFPLEYSKHSIPDRAIEIFRCF